MSENRSGLDGSVSEERRGDSGNGRKIPDPVGRKGEKIVWYGRIPRLERFGGRKVHREKIARKTGVAYSSLDIILNIIKERHIFPFRT